MSNMVTSQVKFFIEEFLYKGKNCLGGRARHGSVVYNDKMYIFGGSNNIDNSINYDQLYSLDLSIELFY